MPAYKQPEPTGEQSNRVPRRVCVIQRRVLGLGNGLIVLQPGQIVDDPWIVQAIVDPANDVAYVVRES